MTKTINKFICLLIMLVPFAAAGQHGAWAAKKSVKVLKKKLGTVEQKIQSVKHKISVTKGEMRTVSGQLSLVESKLEDAQTSLSDNNFKLQDAQGRLKVINKRLDWTQRQLSRREKLLKRRVVDIYEGDDIGFVNVVLGATDMWTFLTRAYYLQAILDSDTELIAQIKKDKAQIVQDKNEQVQKVAQVRGLQVRLQAERDQIDSLCEKKQAQLDRIENNKETYEKMLDEMEAEQRRIEEQIQAYQNTAVGKKWARMPFRGGLSQPVRGRITSRFGYRVHPITGVYKLHDGVDFSVPSGTPVHASADGVVISAGWKGPYGYAVVVGHGGGISTMYAHCSRLLCRAGQTVTRGEVVAKSGSTGYSTGPHVHFSKYINGRAVNPM